MIDPISQFALGAIAGLFGAGVGHFNGYRRGYERGYEGAMAVYRSAKRDARLQALEETGQSPAQRDEPAVAPVPMRTDGFLTYPAGIVAHHGDELVFQIPGFDP